MNLRRFVILFFYFLLFSRFFSETLKVIPKIFDIVNYPFAIILFLYLIINSRKNYSNDNDEFKIIYKLFWFFLVAFIFSWILNINTVLWPAAVLFILGFLEGPLLYIVLTKLVYNKDLLYKNIYVLFTVLFFINLVIVFVVDFPLFFITGNPDIMSGSYGYNAGQFSVLLVIASGLVIGKFYIENRSLFYLLIIQLVIFIIYFFLQYRSAVPMYIFVVLTMLAVTYGKRIVKLALVSTALLFLIFFISSLLIEKDRQVSNLNYQDYGRMIEDPLYLLTFGKFKIYFNTLNMYSEYPEKFISGVGPGNYLSRANYTFSFELVSSFEKGAGPVIKEVFGINYPNFTYFAEKYVNNLRRESILNTWQFANPNSSYLAPIAEIGIFGGIIIIIYFYVIKRSYIHVLRFKKNNNKYLPFAVTALGGFMYLFYLGFLDNWWETARMTMPLWLIFFSTSNIHNEIEKSEREI